MSTMAINLEKLANDLNAELDVHGGKVEIEEDHISLFVNCGCHEHLVSEVDDLDARLVGILHKHRAWLSRVNSEYAKIYFE